MDGIRCDVTGKHRGCTDGSDGLARAIESDRQRMINVGGNRSLAEHHTVRLDSGLLTNRQRCSAERKRYFDPVVCSEQHWNRAWSTTPTGRHIGDADFRMIGKSLERQQKLLGLRQARKQFVLFRRDRLAGLREHSSRRKHARTSHERLFKRFVSIFNDTATTEIYTLSLDAVLFLEW